MKISTMKNLLIYSTYVVLFIFVAWGVYAIFQYQEVSSLAQHELSSNTSYHQFMHSNIPHWMKWVNQKLYDGLWIIDLSLCGILFVILYVKYSLPGLIKRQSGYTD